MIYLDNAATTPVNPMALEAAWPYLTTEFGNPSSTHELGLRAEAALTDARSRVATYFGVRPADVVFTSGSTEGNNFAVIGLALANPRGKHLVSARTEHESVLKSLEFLERIHGFEVSWIPVAHDGSISTDDLAAALRDDTSLVSLMLANNEIGTVHPIAEFAALAHQRGAVMHTDAVQGVGWFDLNLANLGVDALTISGHKFGAPKGSGLAIVRNRLAIEPLLHGGGQEFERRSGTENVAWAVAIATALGALADSGTEGNRVRALSEALISTVRAHVETAQLTGPEPGDNRHPAITSFVFPGINGETLLLELEQQHGIIVSSGSACSAGSDDPSHVLIAAGYDENTARTSVRLSLSHSTTLEEIESAASAIVSAHQSVRALGN